MFCACLNAAVVRGRKPAIRIQRRLRDGRTTNSATAAPARCSATDPVFIGLQKTRLLDPLLSMPGTNDHPGDYRGSGCTACHVIYANDRSPLHSGSYAKFGNQGHSAQADPTIPKTEAGHPIRHEFTLSIPTSQCITCHIHPGTNMVASYLGLPGGTTRPMAI